MTINEELINQLVQRGKKDEIMDDDVIAFMATPRLWRPVPTILTLTPETAQAFSQGVYDELGIKVEVPPVPTLTDKQVKSLKKFGFMLVYVPAITEAQYPAGFVKPDWGQNLMVASIERLPLKGQWVAVETIAKPQYDDSRDSRNYAEDVLMAAVKHAKRFNTSHDDLTGGLLVKIAKTTGFPKKGTRLLSIEERSFIGSLFNWLREHRQMRLPDFGSGFSWEWCANAYGSEDRLTAGGPFSGGLAGVHSCWRGRRRFDSAFRILAVL